MPICLGRILPISRSLRSAKLRVELLWRSRFYLHDARGASTAGTRCFSKCARADRTNSKKTPKKTLSKKAKPGVSSASQRPLPSSTKTGDQGAWLEALEPFLLPQFRTSSCEGDKSNLSTKEKCEAVTNILAEARGNNSAVDVLAELGLKNRRWSAVQSVVKILIEDATSRIKNDPLAGLPSNLGWPTSNTLEDMVFEPIELEPTTSFDAASSTLWDDLHFDPRYTDAMSTENCTAVEQIWMSLGSIILKAADLPREQSQEAMKNVYQIIALLHNSDLVPEHVYSYINNGYDSAVRRPPIVHVLSSRLLTTLSDAVWRAHSDEVIAQAASAGATYKDLGHDPPGGRFRLKVQELGPEVWLEFILWCCADGGFARAGSWIIERMRTWNTESPWFAVQWMSGSGSASPKASVDWNRVKLRHGGAVGLIEGYSTEKPFAEMESRTISVEVVLALVEASLNSRSADMPDRGCTQETVLASITKLLTFLEPHNLPDKYFDYLTVRLFQPSFFEFEKDPKELQMLVNRLKYIRSLESTRKAAGYLPSLDVDSVLGQSEVFAGILHQTLENFAVAGRTGRAVETFTQILELIDQSKLRSIGSFLHTTWRQDEGFFSPRRFAFREEYTSSHGQLPAQKLAPLLDSLTDAGITELGQWLVYSMDVDGPLIPLNLYNRSSLSPSLLRFATATEDHILLRDVANAVMQKPRKPPVSYLRSLIDSNLLLGHFDEAGKALAALTEAKGGGNSLDNIATTIAALIRIESFAEHTWKERRPRHLSPGLSLLDWLLKGDFRGTPGDFRRDQIQNHRRGLASLLRVVEAIPGTLLSRAVRSWILKFADSNVVGLHSRVFDIVLSAVVEMRGARVGMMLWDLFCEEPNSETDNDRYWFDADEMKLVSTPSGLEIQPKGSSLPGSKIRTPNKMLPVKVERSRPAASTEDTISMDDTNGFTSFQDALGLERVNTESHAAIAGGQADNGETKLDDDISRSSSPWVDVDESEQPFQPSNNKSTTLKEDSCMSSQKPPHADITMPLLAFKDMVSESSSPDSSDDDDVVTLGSSPYHVSPVVRPTFRTLRIIIHGALQELEAAKALWYSEYVEGPHLNRSEVPAKANMRALETAMTNTELVEQWAKPLFRKFGLTDEDVAVEFGWKIGDNKGKDGLNIFSTAQLKKRYAAAKEEYEVAKTGVLSELSEVNVSKSFLLGPIRKTQMKVHKYTKREVAFFENLHAENDGKSVDGNFAKEDFTTKNPSAEELGNKHTSEKS
ncbi:hypothetical protein GJ744_001200 [Endocarpon pusillum]|uniref:Uncharacterized protein n=1 Tax=Endocarpon pusillum TaxID=364733 RepID=A0A8H7DZM0_9EURO|nr:hypothetical protein GJ744_001200 [Endocarpon pusillum]